jgi:hypothetical protein
MPGESSIHSAFRRAPERDMDDPLDLALAPPPGAPVLLHGICLSKLLQERHKRKQRLAFMQKGLP